jgi:hypothetical protein
MGLVEGDAGEGDAGEGDAEPVEILSCDILA